MTIRRKEDQDSKASGKTKPTRKGEWERRNRNSCQKLGVEAKSHHPSAINKYSANATVENMLISTQLSTKKKCELTTVTNR